MSYRVAYWMGGSLLGKWQESLPLLTLGEAMNTCRDIVKGGRAACILGPTTPLPDGPPEWWDFDLLRDKAVLPIGMTRIGRLPEIVEQEPALLS
jgi:hypothetical protein